MERVDLLRMNALMSSSRQRTILRLKRTDGAGMVPSEMPRQRVRTAIPSRAATSAGASNRSTGMVSGTGYVSLYDVGRRWERGSVVQRPRYVHLYTNRKKSQNQAK